jgi:SHS2 domain-containing protein
MIQSVTPIACKARSEHLPHDTDIGVRGFGTAPAEAFEQAAPWSFAVIARLAKLLIA